MDGKTKKNNTTKLGITIIAAIILIIIVNTCGTNDKKNETTEQTKSEIKPNESAVEEPAQNWLYTEKVNEMDDCKTYFARTEALEKLQFSFPYDGGSEVWLTVRKSSNGLDVNMEAFPLWTVVLIFTALLIAISFAFFAQHKIHNQPLKKRRKRLLILMGGFLVVFLIITIVCNIQGVNLWHDLFHNIGFIILLLLGIVEFLYGYFHKDKKQIPSGADKETNKANEAL